MDDDRIVDRVDIGRALDLIAAPPGSLIACCPKDGEPLVMTFEFAGAEFVCVVCDGKFGFLSPDAKETTPELVDRAEANEVIYNRQRAAREAGAS